MTPNTTGQEVTMPDEGGWIDQEFADGYRDGRDKFAPEPSDNRSAAYRHSFAVGRAELAGCPIPAHVSRERAAAAVAKDSHNERSEG